MRDEKKDNNDDTDIQEIATERKDGCKKEEFLTAAEGDGEMSGIGKNEQPMNESVENWMKIMDEKITRLKNKI